MKKYKVISWTEYEDYIKMKSERDSINDRSRANLESNVVTNDPPISSPTIKTEIDPPLTPVTTPSSDADNLGLKSNKYNTLLPPPGKPVIQQQTKNGKPKGNWTRDWRKTIR